MELLRVKRFSEEEKEEEDGDDNEAPKHENNEEPLVPPPVATSIFYLIQLQANQSTPSRNFILQSIKKLIASIQLK